MHILKFQFGDKYVCRNRERRKTTHSIRGESLKVELLSAEEGSTIEFDKVLMISNGGESKIGNPYVENAKVTAKLVQMVSMIKYVFSK